MLRVLSDRRLARGSLAPRGRLGGRLTPRAGLALLSAAFVLLVILVNPLHNYPLSDDWEYARTAWTLLNTGQFYRSPQVQATVVFPAVWGALFSAALGLSFTTLRLSTIPLGLGAVLAFYALLGELAFDPLRRALGALTLMLGPLFVFYTHSFMTDVPFLFWMMLGLWLSVRAMRLNRPTLMFWGSASAALAFLTRQLGLALPLAVVAVVVLQRPRREWLAWLAASTTLPLIAVGLFYARQSFGGGANWADAAITAGGTLRFLLRPQTPAEVARRAVIIFVTTGLYLAPLWLAAWPALPAAWRTLRALDRRRQAAIGVGAVFFLGSVVYFGARGEWWPYLNDSVTEAGLRPFLAHYGYLAGDRRPPFFSAPVWVALTLVGAGLAGALAALGLAHMGRRLSLVYAVTLALGLANLVFVLFYERYFLQFIPGAIVLALDATRRVRLAWVSAVLGLMAMAALSVALMQDYWGWHTARWAKAEALIAQGVPLTHLDGGLEWNGWRLSDAAYAYIRANNAPMTTNPWEYVIDPEYMLTFTTVSGYRVEESIPFFSPFREGGQDRLLLLRREGAAR